MTGQIPDRVIYKGERFDICGIKGTGLLSPLDFGMRPIGFSSACWRGYYATYEVSDSALFLVEMSTWVEHDAYKPITGIMPAREPEEEGRFQRDPTYKNLRVRAPFTGRLLIARDFIGGMYIHMGFQKPVAFKTVIEFIVENGGVQEAYDHSELMQQMREELQARRDNPEAKDSPRNFNDIAGWINDRFSLDYDF